MSERLWVIRHQLWMALGRHEAGLPLFRLYAAITGRDVRAVDRSTDLVIEGFPRSANTYALVAFRLAQRRPVRIAHHVHGPSQIWAAIRWNVPVLLLVREPGLAVASLLVRYPKLSPKTCLENYIRFYKPLLESRGAFVVGSFIMVTKSFPTVIRQVNRVFGTAFLEGRSDPGRVKQIFAAIDELDRRDRGEPEANPQTVARPSTDRDRLLRITRQRLQMGASRDLLEQAQSVYKQVLDNPNLEQTR